MKVKEDFVYKKSTTMKKREITVMDGSTTESCVLQLWNDDIEKVEYVDNTVATFRRLKVCYLQFANVIIMFNIQDFF